MKYYYDELSFLTKLQERITEIFGFTRIYMNAQEYTNYINKVKDSNPIPLEDDCVCFLGINKITNGDIECKISFRNNFKILNNEIILGNKLKIYNFNIEEIYNEEGKLLYYQTDVDSTFSLNIKE